MHLDEPRVRFLSFITAELVVGQLGVVQRLIECPPAEPVEVLGDVQRRLVWLEELGEDSAANGGER